MSWYDENKREMPWRSDPSPYHVWVSEIMLQQTRVEAVRDYYKRFLEALPDIEALSKADEDVLLKLWEGLGYYSRARNLQKAAKLVMEMGGTLPSDYDELKKLPGIGDYTAAAIASIAFGKKAPVVDGNVLRVVTRISSWDANIDRADTKKETFRMLKEEMPETRCGDFNQAMMELGATVCLPNGAPLCERCPAHSLCRARAQDRVFDFPVREEKKARRIEKKTVLLLEKDGLIALRRRPKKGLLAGLWEFPHLEGVVTEKGLREALLAWGLQIESVEPLPKAKHIFSHVEWKMNGFFVTVSQAGEEADELCWVTSEQLKRDYAVPAAFDAFKKKLTEAFEK